MVLKQQSVVILDAGTLGDDSSFESLLMDLDVHLQIYQSTSSEQVVERTHDADIVITNKVRFSQKEFERCPRLKMIQVLATGVDNIDVDAADDHKVAVYNVRGYSTDSVAQLVWAGILSLFTKLHLHYNTHTRWAKAENFTLFDHQPVLLSGKTLGVIGMGAIGSAVAEKAVAFGMKTVAMKRIQGMDTRPGRLPLNELLSVSDVITLHCPLNDDTAELINSESLRNVKPGAMLINTGRGGLIEETAVLEALKSGTLGGVLLDVLSVEPPPADSPVVKMSHPNLLVTPHIGWATKAAINVLLQEVKKNIASFCMGECSNENRVG